MFLISGAALPLLAEAAASGLAAEPGSTFGRVLFVAACLALPVAWGVLVNWLFDLWHRRPVEADADRIFPDYQI